VLLVIYSLVEIVYFWSKPDDGTDFDGSSGDGGGGTFRASRVWRIVFLLQSARKVRERFEAMFHTISSLIYVYMLVVLELLVFGTFGFLLFSHIEDYTYCRASECSCGVHLCSLHSAHANLTINMQLRVHS
jgi:hypothetical protein